MNKTAALEVFKLFKLLLFKSDNKSFICLDFRLCWAEWAKNTKIILSTELKTNPFFQADDSRSYTALQNSEEKRTTAESVNSAKTKCKLS